MKVYVSSFGKVMEATVTSKTTKGYRVVYENPYHNGVECRGLYYIQCPNGNHRTFLDRQDAVADAVMYVEAEELKAETTLRDLCEKRRVLAGW
jgi:hypothetical protein